MVTCKTVLLNNMNIFKSNTVIVTRLIRLGLFKDPFKSSIVSQNYFHFQNYILWQRLCFFHLQKAPVYFAVFPEQFPTFTSTDVDVYKTNQNIQTHLNSMSYSCTRSHPGAIPEWTSTADMILGSEAATGSFRRRDQSYRHQQRVNTIISQTPRP